jgi:predicted ribosome quality control (RQC) complex YloA/Tae2 family protein
MELQKVRELLEHPTFYLIEHVKKLELTLLPAPNYLEQYARAMDALHHFFNRAVQQEAFRVEKTSAIQALTIQIKNAEAFLKKNQLKLTELQHDLHWQQWADLVMANLHRIQPGAEQVEVENFYDDHKPLVIPLKKDLNGQRNAEVFYRKGKNQHIEVSKLSESIEKKTRDLFALKNKLEEVEGALTLQELQLKVGGLTRSKQTEPARPYHEFIFQGYKIWVGKDAQSNDELTLKLSYKDDLWLHAKDVAGSHVLIKHQAGKNFPKDVIERAAELAAYNSKRKTDTLCPVSVTPKKYVRKRKGDPAGAVIVEKEDVILVEPRLER